MFRNYLFTTLFLGAAASSCSDTQFLEYKNPKTDQSQSQQNPIQTVISPTPNGQYPDGIQDPSVVGNLKPILPQTETLEKTSLSEGQYTGSGKFGDHEVSYRSPGGLSSSALIDFPNDNGPQVAHGVLIYLHGDGAGDYRGYWSKLRSIGKKYGIATVSVKAPKQNSWYKDGSGHGEYLNSLLQDKIFKEYNVKFRKVAFTGASGGPQFLTGQFLPQYGNNYALGMAFPVCGGGGTVGYRGQIEKLNPSEDFKKYFKLHYNTGTSDFLFRDAKSSYDFYRGKGISNIKFEDLTGQGHCQFAEGVTGVIDKLLTQYIN